jgi:AcrR family transcriptional regulator
MTASKTFKRLPETKKHDFLGTAYKEFALHDYESASITNLVKELGIAKGSVYQYFKDKQALYEYLISNAFNTLEELTAAACPYNNEAFFDWFTRYLIVQTKFQLSFPHYALLFQHLEKKTEPETKQIHQEIESRWEHGIIFNFPPVLFDTKQSTFLLSRSVRLIFNLIVHSQQIDLVDTVKNGQSIDLPGEVLVEYCSSWADLLRKGIPL